MYTEISLYCKRMKNTVKCLWVQLVLDNLLNEKKMWTLFFYANSEVAVMRKITVVFDIKLSDSFSQIV